MRTSGPGEAVPPRPRACLPRPVPQAPAPAPAPSPLPAVPAPALGASVTGGLASPEGTLDLPQNATISEPLEHHPPAPASGPAPRRCQCRIGARMAAPSRPPGLASPPPVTGARSPPPSPSPRRSPCRPGFPTQDPGPARPRRGRPDGPRARRSRGEAGRGFLGVTFQSNSQRVAGATGSRRGGGRLPRRRRGLAEASAAGSASPAPAERINLGPQGEAARRPRRPHPGPRRHRGEV